MAGHSDQGRSYARRTLPHGIAARREAMDIDWMSRVGLSESIPPAYTEYLGRQFLDQLT